MARAWLPRGFRPSSSFSRGSVLTGSPRTPLNHARYEQTRAPIREANPCAQTTVYLFLFLPFSSLFLACQFVCISRRGADVSINSATRRPSRLISIHSRHTYSMCHEIIGRYSSRSFSSTFFLPLQKLSWSRERERETNWEYRTVNERGDRKQGERSRFYNWRCSNVTGRKDRDLYGNCYWKLVQVFRYTSFHGQLWGRRISLRYSE